jgi:NAD+ synthase
MELVTDGGPDLLLSTPWVIEDKLYSAHAADLGRARLQRVGLKHDLPNYGPFDEKRVFTAGPLPEPILWRGISLGVPVCEDIWTPKVCAHLAAQGAELFLVTNGSPYEYGKINRRENIVSDRARESRAPRGLSQSGRRSG